MFLQALVIDHPNEVYNHFGQPGDLVMNGAGSDKPYKGPGHKNTTHDGMYGSGRYLVQNKGLILYACGNPLFDAATVDPANDTEKAIILAIAMQASTLACSLSSS